MSGRRTKARKRRSLLEKFRAEFRRIREQIRKQKRKDPKASSVDSLSRVKAAEAMVDLLRRVADSNLRVWAVARPADGDDPLDEMERAMIAQTVAPRLAGMAPGSVHRRHEFSRRTRSATATEQDAGGAGDVSRLTLES
jgi:hypothetical protein